MALLLFELVDGMFTPLLGKEIKTVCGNIWQCVSVSFWENWIVNQSHFFTTLEGRIGREMKTRMVSQRFLMVAMVICLGLSFTAQGSLIAQWTFNEDSGDALDLTANGQDATLVNAPSRITNGAIRHMELNGTSQYAWAPAGPGTALNDDIVVSNAVTVSSWVRVDIGTAFVGEPAIGKIYGYTGSGNYHLYGITFAGTAGTNGRVYSYAGRSLSGQPTAAADSIFDGNWHNITFTFQGGVAGTDAYLYFDGTQVGSTDMDETITGGDLNFLMGTRDWIGNTDQYYFDGGIDEVQVYDAALSQAEITTLVNNGPVPIPEPVTMVFLGLGSVLFTARRRR